MGLVIYHSLLSNPYVSTSAGTNVLNRLGDARLTFSDVTASGNTTISTIDPTTTGLTVPAGYTIVGNSQAYNITSTAEVSGTIDVCVKTVAVVDPVQFNRLALLHGEFGALVDRTTSRDYIRREICGLTTSLSPFVIAKQNTYSISGQITANNNPLQNVTVSLSNGSTTQMMTTGANGNYSFSDLLEGGNFTVTPQLANYAFDPTNATFNNIAADKTANFAAAACSIALNPTQANAPAAGFSGSFAVTTNGCQWTAATNDNWITLSGTTTGNQNGSVSYSVNANNGAARTGTITVGGQSFTINQAAASYIISGQITFNNSALSNVSVALSGSSAGTTTTNAQGNYSFTIAAGGNYTITPTLTGYDFTPPNHPFTNVLSNKTGNFTAAVTANTISGNVKADGANLQGATVLLTGGQTATTSTDAGGNYSFTVPGARVIPSAFIKTELSSVRHRKAFQIYSRIKPLISKTVCRSALRRLREWSLGIEAKIMLTIGRLKQRYV